MVQDKSAKSIELTLTQIDGKSTWWNGDRLAHAGDTLFTIPEDRESKRSKFSVVILTVEPTRVRIAGSGLFLKSLWVELGSRVTFNLVDKSIGTSQETERNA